MRNGDIFEPMLARGELHMIGATTLDEYRKRIEKDAALERRFQPVHGRRAVRRGRRVDPRGLRERFEVFHGVEDRRAARWSPR